MEGFGMSAQEAAATGKPVIASSLVPFAREYLLGSTPERVAWDHDPSKDLLLGNAGIIVPPDFIEGFANAMVRILSDDAWRRAMGAEALKITVPYFTWGHLSAKLMSDLGFSPSQENRDG
jgi:glycosyltransferase involved in cell wall biosynthesis